MGVFYAIMHCFSCLLLEQFLQSVESDPLGSHWLSKCFSARMHAHSNPLNPLTLKNLGSKDTREWPLSQYSLGNEDVQDVWIFASEMSMSHRRK